MNRHIYIFYFIIAVSGLSNVFAATFNDPKGGITFELPGPYIIYGDDDKHTHFFMREGKGARGTVSINAIPKSGYDILKDPDLFKIKDIEFTDTKKFDAGETTLTVSYFTFEDIVPEHMKARWPRSGGFIIWGTANGYLYRVLAMDMGSKTLNDHKELSSIIKTINIKNISSKFDLAEPGNVIDLADEEPYISLIGKTLIVNDDGLYIYKYTKPKYTEFYKNTVGIKRKQLSIKEIVANIPKGTQFLVQSIKGKNNSKENARILSQYKDQTNNVYDIEILYNFLSWRLESSDKSKQTWMSVKED